MVTKYRLSVMHQFKETTLPLSRPVSLANSRFFVEYWFTHSIKSEFCEISFSPSGLTLMNIRFVVTLPSWKPSLSGIALMFDFL